MFESLLVTESGEPIIPQFLGEFTSAEFITNQEFCTLVGLTSGTLIGTGTRWVKIIDVDKKTKVFPLLPIRNGMTWNYLDGIGLVSGKTITIGEETYIARMFRSEFATWAQPNFKGDEHNNLIYSIASGRPAAYTGARYKEYTNAELGNGWNFTTGRSGNNCLSRGNPIANGGGTSITSTNGSVAIYRPLLELIP